MTSVRRSCTALALGLLLAGIGRAACAGPMTAEQFEDFFSHYHLRPDPQRLPAALEFFAQASAGAPALPEDEPAARACLAGRARFFAVLASSQPGVLQNAERLFEKSPWTRKTALLEIFKRVENAQLDDKLAAWCKLEEDDDRRVLLEHVRVKISPGLSVLEQPAQDRESLAEQWACFFATGNTVAAGAVFAFLSESAATAPAGTTLAAGQEPGSATGRAALADFAWAELARQARSQAPVRKLAAEELRREGPEDYRLRLAGLLAALALNLRDADLGRMVAPSLGELWVDRPQELDYFQGGLAALSGNTATAEKCRAGLAAKQPVLAERLRGYQAWAGFWQERPNWQPGPPQAGAEAVAQKCREALAVARGFRTYGELMVRRYRPGACQDDRVYHLATLHLDPEVCFAWQNAGASEGAWRQDAGQTCLWNQADGSWAPVHSRSLRGQIEGFSGPGPLARVLAEERPESLAPVATANGKIWQLRYALPDIQDLADPRWESGFQADRRRGSLKIYVQPETGRVLETHLAYEAARGDTPCARLSLERIYYDYAAPDLARWQEMK